ncbi:hypothetical protein IEI94_18790 [Halomonas sp. ML-15]|uniref:DUF2201 family putative metallopeptidase n=1 Tax=Halomonas sp. ML-15 TaxID=2773305 RepID=UPI0017462118|nr:hypothetical protein [Halomonas sp. ML-15]MBD3897908.1 hypothetical protein [Halomonas sp. ML-15]
MILEAFFFATGAKPRSYRHNELELLTRQYVSQLGVLLFSNHLHDMRRLLSLDGTSLAANTRQAKGMTMTRTTEALEPMSSSKTHTPCRAKILGQWEEDRRAWRIQHPATARLAEGLPIEQALGEVKTATTDGARLLVNTDWSAGLDTTTRRFVQAHLVWHAAAGDYRPIQQHDEHRWHLACDHAVNAQLLLLGFPLADDAILFPACIARSVFEVYAWLADHPWPEAEYSLDRLAGQIDLSPSADKVKYLDHAWRQRIHNVVRDYLGTSCLPNAVAAWLLTRR